MSKSSGNVFLEITKGPHKGEKFSLAQKTTIGRSDQTQVCLSKDQRVSRTHAIIVFASNNFYIKNLSSNNKLFVNKKEVKESPLKVTDLVSIGSSQFRLIIKSTTKATSKRKTNFDSKKPLLNPVRLALIFIIAFSFYFILNSDESKETNQREVASSSEDKTTTTSTEPIIRPISIKKEVNIDAQSEYIKGFRDFKKGQYARALIHLENCLNYQPEHELCNRYQILSQKKVDEIIQYQTITGRKFLDQKQYKACSASFRNIAFLIQNKEDRRYQEAKKNEAFCRQMLKESF